LDFQMANQADLIRIPWRTNVPNLMLVSSFARFLSKIAVICPTTGTKGTGTKESWERGKQGPRRRRKVGTEENGARGEQGPRRAGTKRRGTKEIGDRGD